MTLPRVQLGRKRLLCLLMLALIAASVPAGGHSYLSQTDPPLGASLAAWPEAFELSFTEGVDPGFSTFELYSTDGQKLQSLDFRLQQEGERVVLPLGQPPAEGAYHLHWKVLSVADGHVTEGVIPFAVGTELVPAGEAFQGRSEFPATTRLLARWLGFATLLLLIGGAWCFLFLPALPTALRARSQLRLLGGALLVFIVAGTVDLLYQARLLDASLFQLLLNSRWGTLQAAKGLFVMALGLFLWTGIEGRLTRYGVWTLGGLALLAQALVSHNANLGWPGAAADWAHLAAAALWLGGLAQLALVWLPWGLRASDEARAALAGTLIPAFSQVALVSVIALVASGTWAAFQHVPSLEALWSTLYGRALAGKVLLLLPIGLLAGANRWLLVPRLQQSAAARPDGERARWLLSRFRRLVGGEAALGAVVLLFAGVLTLASPPHAGHAHGARPEPLTLIRQLDAHTVGLRVAPADENGSRALTVTLREAAGDPVADALRVWVRFDYLERDLGDVNLSPIAEPTEAGRYALEGPYLNLPGRWRATVVARLRGRIDDLEAAFALEVGPGGVRAAEAASETEAR